MQGDVPDAEWEALKAPKEGEPKEKEEEEGAEPKPPVPEPTDRFPPPPMHVAPKESIRLSKIPLWRFGEGRLGWGRFHSFISSTKVDTIQCGQIKTIVTLFRTEVVKKAEMNMRRPKKEMQANEFCIVDFGCVLFS